MNNEVPSQVPKFVEGLLIANQKANNKEGENIKVPESTDNPPLILGPSKQT